MPDFLARRGCKADMLALAVVVLGVPGLSEGRQPPAAAGDRLPLPAVVVSAAYPGASAQDVAQHVAAPMEKQLRGLRGLASLTTVCTKEGEVKLVATLQKGTDLDQALAEVRRRLEPALPALPEVVRGEVKIRKRSSPLLGLALVAGGNDADRAELARLAQQVRDDLVRVPHVAEVVLLGAAETPQLLLTLDPNKLAAFGLTREEVLKHVRQYDLPLAGKRQVQELGETVIKKDAMGQPIRVKDVALIRSEPGLAALCRLDGQSCVFLIVHHTYGADAAETARGVTARLTEVRRRLPANVALRELPEPPEPGLLGHGP